MPVVLLHGFGTCAFLWRYVAPLLAEGGHTAYAIDMIGHGESDRSPDTDFGIAAQAEYLDAAMTALRVARAVIVGNDLGGDVALRLAATRGERVDGLVLINTPAFDELPARDITTMQLSTARFAFRVMQGVLGAAPLLQQVLHGSVATPEHMPDRLVARYLAPFAGRDGVNHLLRLAAAVQSDDVNDLNLEEIDTTTLVIRSDEDKWLSQSVADLLVKSIPKARLACIPDAGRLVPEEDPKWLCEQLFRFIRECADQRK
jgi:pimeloyl-ACP methyl ester carboxylesterase